MIKRLTNYLFVTPLIGYSNETYGITRGNKFDVGDHELIHDYDVIERFNHFNYGLGLMARPISEVEIGCVASAHAHIWHFQLFPWTEEITPFFQVLNTFADYKYEDGQYVVDGDMVFQYKKILVGRSPNAECMGSYIVLTNDPDITYEKVDRSLFSSNMKDWLTDTMIIGMQPLTDEFESFSCWPTENERIARQFDADDHPETDIAGEKGTPVSSVSDGTVVSAEFSTDYGNSIVILSKNALIRYSYLDSINVNECDEVKAGDVIGSLGSTGRSTGPHLGISMTVDEKPVNVMDYYVKAAEN